MNPEHFGKQFNMGKDEEKEISTRALGDHLFEGAEIALLGGVGGFKALVNEEAARRLRHFPMQPTRTSRGSIVSLQDDTDEKGEADYGLHGVVQHPSGWSVKWSGGTYAEIHTPKGNPVEVFNFSMPNGEIATVHPDELDESLHEFVNNENLSDYGD